MIESPFLKRIFLSKLLLAAVALVAIYAFSGFILLPRVAANYLKGYAEEDLERKLTLEELRFNPFTLVLEAEGVRLAGKDEALILGLGFLRADLQVSSLYHRAWTLSEIVLREPRLNFVLQEDGTSNLSRLVRDMGGAPSGPSNEQPAQNGTVPLLVRQVRAEEGRVDFKDYGARPAEEASLASIKVEFIDVTTLPERTGEFSISGRTLEGEELHWKGGVSLNPLRSEGTIRIRGLKAATTWRLLGKESLARDPRGSLDVEGRYEVDLSGTRALVLLEDLDLGFRGLNLDPSGEALPNLSIGEISLSGGRFDSRTRVLSLGEIRLNGGEVRAAEEVLVRLDRAAVKGGLVDLRERRLDCQEIRLGPGSGLLEFDEEGRPRHWAVLTTPTVGGMPDPEEGHEAGEEDLSWTLSVDSLEVEDFRAALADLSTEPAASMILEPLELSVEGLTTEPERSVSYELRTGVEAGGEIAIKGTALPWQGKGKADVDLKKLSLAPAEPYVSRFIRLKIDRGSVDVSGTLSLGPPEGFAFRGETTVDSLRLVEKDGTPYFSLESLACSGIRLSPEGPWSMDQARLVRPEGSLIIHEDHTVNISRILDPEEGNDRTGVRESATGSGEEEAGAGAAEMSLTRLMVDQGILHFEDRSLRLPFKTVVREMGGTVSGLSSETGSRTDIELDGRVSKHGLARIRGSMNFFDPIGSTDVSMVFQNIEMTELTPYAVRFAGYRISSGKLDMDLDYEIAGAKMVGNHQIIADHLVLGEKVESPEALDVPLELAVALLKDSNDRIDIRLPVSGDLQNPQFDFSRLIRRAIGNILKKIVTAPFTWLGRLAEAGQTDLKRLSFEPGKSVVPPPEKEKLAALSKALQKRPALRLIIHGGYDPDADAEALRTTLIREKTARGAGRELEPGERPGPPVFHDPRTQEAVRGLFTFYHSAGELEELRREHGLDKEAGIPKDNGTEAALETAFYEELYELTREKLPLPPGALEILARKRAAAAREVLVQEGGISPGRVKSGELEETGTGKGGGILTRFSLGHD